MTVQLDTPSGVSSDDLALRIGELEERLAAHPDPVVGELADELVGAVMDLYGEGLRRILRALAEGGPAAVAVRDALLADGVVAGLLLIHDLHPVPLETRVEEALESVRPYLYSHKGDVELVRLEDGIARLRLQGSCDGCPSSASTLELAITQALDEAAPDLAGIEVEGAVAPPSFAGGAAPARRRRRGAGSRLDTRRRAERARARHDAGGRRRAGRASSSRTSAARCSRT